MCVQMCYELLTIVYHIIYIIYIYIFCLLECLECLLLPHDEHSFSTLTLRGTNQAAQKLEGF